MIDSEDENKKLDQYGVWVKAPEESEAQPEQSTQDDSLPDFSFLDESDSASALDTTDMFAEEPPAEKPAESPSSAESLELDDFIAGSSDESPVAEPDPTESVPDIPDVSADIPDGEVDLDSFFSDSSESAATDSHEDGEVNLDDFLGGDSSSGDSGDISLDSFLDPSEFGLETETKEEEVTYDQPMDIDLSFDDSVQTETEEDDNSSSSSVTDTEAEDYDALFDNIVDEGPKEAPPARSTGPSLDDSSEEVDLDEFGLGDIDTGFVKGPDSNKPKATTTVDYDISVDTDDGGYAEDTVSETDSSENDEESVEIEVEESETSASAGSNDTDFGAPDDSFDVDSLLNTVDMGSEEKTETSQVEKTEAVQEEAAAETSSDSTEEEDTFSDETAEAQKEPSLDDFIVDEASTSEDDFTVPSPALEDNFELPKNQSKDSDDDLFGDSETEENTEYNIPEFLPDETTPVEKSVTEEPVVEESITEEPVVEESITEEPVVEESVTEEPAFEESITEEPAFEESITEEPAFEESVTEEPVVEEPVVEEPVVEESVTEEPAFEEPVTEEPVVEESVTEEPAFEEPVTEEPVTEEPVVEESVSRGIPTTEAVDNTDILKSIASELASLKSEIAGLKTEFADLRNGTIPATSSENVELPLPQEGAPAKSGFFGDEDDGDDSITLSMEELNNVAQDASPQASGFFGDEDDGDDSITLSMEELNNVAQDATEKAKGFFGDDDDGDDSIALSGDEMSNIMNSAEFTQEEIEAPQADIEESIPEDNGLSMNFAEEKLEEPVFDEDLMSSESSDEEDEEIEGLPSEISVRKSDDDIFVESSSSDMLQDDAAGANGQTVEDIPEETDEIEEELPDVAQVEYTSAEGYEAPIDLFENDEVEPMTEKTFEYLENDAAPTETDIAEEEESEGAINDEPAEGVFNQWNGESAEERSSEEATVEEPVVPTVTALETSTETAPSSETSQGIPENMKQEIKSVLSYMDQLLESLPEEKITEFAKSEQFETYKKLFTELGLA